MGMRLLPRNLQELYAHSLILEREATKRFSELERYMRDAGMDHIADEFESIGREEREQYELLAVGTAGHELPEISPWEYTGHYLGVQADVVRAPKTTRRKPDGSPKVRGGKNGRSDIGRIEKGSLAIRT